MEQQRSILPSSDLHDKPLENAEESMVPIEGFSSQLEEKAVPQSVEAEKQQIERKARLDKKSISLEISGKPIPDCEGAQPKSKSEPLFILSAVGDDHSFTKYQQAQQKGNTKDHPCKEPAADSGKHNLISAYKHPEGNAAIGEMISQSEPHPELLPSASPNYEEPIVGHQPMQGQNQLGRREVPKMEEEKNQQQQVLFDDHGGEARGIRSRPIISRTALLSTWVDLEREQEQPEGEITEEQNDAIEEHQNMRPDEYDSLVAEFESGRFDEKFKRIFDMDETCEGSEDSSDFELDCFDETEEEKRENRIKLKAYMVETLLMKYKIYLPQDSVHMLEYHVTHITSLLSDGAPQMLQMAMSDFIKFVFNQILAHDPRGNREAEQPRSIGEDLEIKGDFPRLREWFSQRQKSKLSLNLVQASSVPIQEIQGLDFWKYLFDDFKFGQFVVMKRQDALI